MEEAFCASQRKVPGNGGQGGGGAGTGDSCSPGARPPWSREQSLPGHMCGDRWGLQANPSPDASLWVRTATANPSSPRNLDALWGQEAAV